MQNIHENKNFSNNSPLKLKKNPKQMTIEELDQKLKGSNSLSLSGSQFNKQKPLTGSVSRTDIKKNDDEYIEDSNMHSRLKLNYKYNNNSKLYEYEKDRDNPIYNMDNVSFNKLGLSGAFSPLNNSINNKNINHETILTETLLENDEKLLNFNKKNKYSDLTNVDRIDKYDKDSGNCIIV